MAAGVPRASKTFNPPTPPSLVQRAAIDRAAINALDPRNAQVRDVAPQYQRDNVQLLRVMQEARDAGIRDAVEQGLRETLPLEDVAVARTPIDTIVGTERDRRAGARRFGVDLTMPERSGFEAEGGKVSWGAEAPFKTSNVTDRTADALRAEAGEATGRIPVETRVEFAQPVPVQFRRDPGLPPFMPEQPVAPVAPKSVPPAQAEPPAGVSSAPGKFKFPLPEQQGGGWYVTSDWRSAFVKLPDLWNRVDLLRAVANNRGSKASLQDLQDALERGRQMLEAMRRGDSQVAPDLTNLGWDISSNPAANAALKAEAIKFREDAFEYYSRPQIGRAHV